jgi:AAA+ superfamily predicted ATPase
LVTNGGMMKCYNCNHEWNTAGVWNCPECDTMWNQFSFDLTAALLADQKLIMVNSGEWERLRDGILNSIDAEQGRGEYEEKRTLLRFGDVSMLQGWMEERGKFTSEHPDIKANDITDPLHDQINAFRDSMMEPGILWVDDLHLLLQADSQAYQETLMTHLRHFVRINLESNGGVETRKTIIVTGENVDIGGELRHESLRIELPLPNIPVLKQIIEMVADENDLSSEQVDISDEFAQTAVGLSTQQAMAAFRKAIVNTGGLTGDEAMKLIIKTKSTIVAESGCLEFLELDVDMDSVGGLENLKRWMEVSRNAYSIKAREENVPMPKGLLMVGVPGCGKSLTAKAVASTWNFPLIRLDIGAAFGGVVGQSETNIREALKIAEAASPCVLFIDEIEKGLAGAGGDGNLDSGVTQRVFGTILTWLNDVGKPVFVVATSNNLSNLPPELKRKGRFDEIFFLDLPGEESRMEILQIHLKKWAPTLMHDVGLAEIAKKTVDFTGAELEAIVKDAKKLAFSLDQPVSIEHLKDKMKSCTPMAKSMKDDIDEMRTEADLIGMRASLVNSKNDSGTKEVRGRTF